jgi:methylmalonyl-CoA/ethylmalonyl-CoA epimerase
MSSNPSSLLFHHFGRAVRRPEATRKYLLAHGFELGEPVFDPSQNVHLQMAVCPGHPAVEIIWPGEIPGPTHALLERNRTGIIYHVCYETDNLPSVLAHWEAAGLNVVCFSPPTPAPLFNGRKVSFYHVSGMGMIELLEPA